MEYVKELAVNSFQAVKEHLQLGGEHQLWLVFSIVVFLLIFPWGAETWLQANSVIMFGTGLSCLVFPHWWSKQIVDGKTDSLQYYEWCCIGAMGIAQGLTSYLLQNSGDKTVRTSLLWAMTLEFGLVVPVDINYMLNPGKKGADTRVNVEMISIDSHMVILWFLTSAFYALRETDWGGYTEVVSMKRNVHLRVDFVINLVNGLLAYTLPSVACKFQTNLKTLNVVHAYLARIMGASMIQMAITSGRSSNFLKEADKKSVLMSHAVCYGLFLCIMVLFQFFTTTFSAYHTLYGMGMVTLSLINALMGCDLKYTLGDVPLKARRFLGLKSE